MTLGSTKFSSKRLAVSPATSMTTASGRRITVLTWAPFAVDATYPPSMSSSTDPPRDFDLTRRPGDRRAADGLASRRSRLRAAQICRSVPRPAARLRCVHATSNRRSRSGRAGDAPHPDAVASCGRAAIEITGGDAYRRISMRSDRALDSCGDGARCDLDRAHVAASVYVVARPSCSVNRARPRRRPACWWRSGLSTARSRRSGSV